MDEPINEDMVALMKNSAPSIEREPMASNDNYNNRRVQCVESEFAGALVLENEPA